MGSFWIDWNDLLALHCGGEIDGIETDGLCTMFVSVQNLELVE